MVRGRVEQFVGGVPVHRLFDLSGRVALVTGASAGLGAHFAKTLAEAGAKVVVAARRRERLSALTDEITAAGASALSVEMDVTSSDSVGAGFAEAQAALGPVSILINNAGIAIPGPSIETEDDDWDQVLNTNLRGAWLAAREAARRMIAADVEGNIVNIASIVAFRVMSGLASYGASKAGLVQLTRALAVELARHRIRVNAIAPGYIRTDMNREFFDSRAGQALIERMPQRRLGRPEELDGALLLLASAASSYMTGSVITVDGGHAQSKL